MAVSRTYRLCTHGPCVYTMTVLIFAMTITFSEMNIVGTYSSFSLLTEASGLELVCPDIVYLWSSTHLVCSGNSPVSFKTPLKTTAAACSMERYKCIPHGNYRASVVNSTSSEVTITNTSHIHAGEWTCSTGSEVRTCSITVAEVPSCTVTANNVNTLSVGDDLSLTVNITGYYCSKEVRFHLTIGNISKTIDSSDGGEVVAAFNVSITEAHFGRVGLTFECGDDSQRVACDGVQTLAEDPGTANIYGEPPTQITTSKSSGVIYAAGVISLLILVLIAIILHSMWKEATRKHHPPTPPTVGWLAGGRDAEDSVCLIHNDHDQEGTGGIGADNSGFLVDEQIVSARGRCESWMSVEEKALAERHLETDFSTRRGLRLDSADDASQHIMASCMQDIHLRRTFIAITQRMDQASNQEVSYLSF